MSKEPSGTDIWTIIASLAAVGAIAAAIIIAVFQKKKKKFTYEILTTESLFRVDKTIKDKISINYKGRKIKSLDLLIIRFANTGNQPILASDIVSAVYLDFEKSSKILSIEVENQNPEGLSIVPENTEHRIQLPKVLLNAGDSFDLKILISDHKVLPEVGGRIVGVKNIGPRRDRDLLFVLGSLIGILGFFGGFIGLSVATYRSNQGNFVRPEEVPWLITVGVSMVIMLVSAATNRNIRFILLRLLFMRRAK